MYPYFRKPIGIRARTNSQRSELSSNCWVYGKVHSFCKQCLHKDLVFINWQLMSAMASLERFGEEDVIFINWRSCRHCLQNEWPLVDTIHSRYQTKCYYASRCFQWQYHFLLRRQRRTLTLGSLSSHDFLCVCRFDWFCVFVFKRLQERVCDAWTDKGWSEVAKIRQTRIAR